MSAFLGFQPTKSQDYYFVSYNNEDATRVGSIAKALSESGVSLWYDHGIEYGDNWEPVITEKILHAKAIILFFTKGILPKNNSYVQKEYKIATQHYDKKIYIVMLDRINKEEVPVEKVGWWIDLNEKQCINGYDFANTHSLAQEIVSALHMPSSNVCVAKASANENEDFSRVISSKQFAEFTHTVMQQYYGLDFFTEINGACLPVFCVKGNAYPGARLIKDFDVLCDFEESRLSDFDVSEHQSYQNHKWYPEYSKILKGKVKYPNRPGYMLDEIVTNEEGHFDKLRVHVGTYAENLYSTHVLEYELYRAFLEYGEQDIHDPAVWKALRDSLVIRNQMHQNVGEQTDVGYKERMRASLLSGYGRDSLLSVQMLVILYSERNHRYEVKIAQRSNTVAIKPGVYQLIPAGGFEILNDSDDDVYDDIELEDNFSPGCAVFRELLEELFNMPEFQGSGSGSVEDRLLKDTQIIKIEEMLSRGEATLQFLGSVMDLAGMRHELSFALVIGNESYANTQFIANDECKKGVIYSLDINTFESRRSIWNNIHGPSAAMWHLFKETPLYKELITPEDQSSI